MDAQPRSRRVNRNHTVTKPPAQRGQRQIAIRMTPQEYNDSWHDPDQVRTIVDRERAANPELFPDCLNHGYGFHGFARASAKQDGVRLRKIRPTGSTEAFHLRPSFVLPYMTGTIDEVAYPLLLASFGVPNWVLTEGFGHNDMYWHRQVESLGRNSLVGTTVHVPDKLPEHLAADEHHTDWAGEKGYIATTAAEGCVLGIALTNSADEEHLTQAYGVFAKEAREVNPDYTPKTVSTDGWSATQNAFQNWWPTIVTILCFLHGFLKIRERCRKDHELHRRIWDVYRAATKELFHAGMQAFREWFDLGSWKAVVREMVEKLCHRADAYAVAYDHPGCRRTSNAVDRPMNRLYRLVYAGRGLHGHQASSERRLRGWALLMNFRPFAKRGRDPREHQSPAHRLNGKRYSDNWLENLMLSASMNGRRNPSPTIR